MQKILGKRKNENAHRSSRWGKGVIQIECVEISIMHSELHAAYKFSISSSLLAVAFVCNIIVSS